MTAENNAKNQIRSYRSAVFIEHDKLSNWILWFHAFQIVVRLNNWTKKNAGENLGIKNLKYVQVNPQKKSDSSDLKNSAP